MIFYEYFHLSRHIKNVHDKDMKHVCPVCDFCFLIRQELYNHVSKEHEELIPSGSLCKFCDKRLLGKAFVGHKEKCNPSIKILVEVNQDLTLEQKEDIAKDDMKPRKKTEVYIFPKPKNHSKTDIKFLKPFHTSQII